MRRSLQFAASYTNALYQVSDASKVLPIHHNTDLRTSYSPFVTALGPVTLHQRPRSRLPGHRRGRHGYRGGSSHAPYHTISPTHSHHSQEFSIEIPDKEADAIHSGMLPQDPMLSGLMLTQLIVNQAVEYILSQPDGKSFRADKTLTRF
jgi:hypothetical protein